MARLLPLFPLRLVAFPGSAIPLHIFEERYRTMVGAAAKDGSEFGIVLARDKGVVDTGCTVVVERVTERYSDGRFDVLTRGRRRFKLLSVDEAEDCLRGDVEFFDDESEESPSPELRALALMSWEKLRELLGAGAEAPETPSAASPALGFELARSIDDLDFQAFILGTRSESQRLEHFIAFAAKHAEKTLEKERLKLVIRSNGKGHPPTGL
jgi:Lon protease-like protein